MCSTNSYIEFKYFFVEQKTPKMDTICIDCDFVIYTIALMGMRQHSESIAVAMYLCVCVCLQLFKFNGKTAVFAIIWVVNFRLGYKSIKRLTFGPTENCRQYVDLCSCGLFKYLHASNKLLIWLLRRTQFVHYILC